MTTDRKLLFDHIPKTGGQSVAIAVGGAFGEDPRLPAFSNAHRKLFAAAGSRRVLAGHIWFVPGEALRPDWSYCTVLRDPVDRFLSQYYFNRAIATELRANAPDDVRLLDPQVIAAERFDLPEYLGRHESEIVRSYTNVQAAHFAHRLCADPHSLLPHALLETAIRSLAEYRIVGFHEDLQSFVDHVCRHFEVSRIELSLVNVTSSRRGIEELSPEVRGRLEAANEVDRQLIAWARREFGSGPRASHRTTAPPATPAAIAADFGTREIELIAARCVGPHPDPRQIFPGDPVRLELECDARIAEPDLTIGMAVTDATGATVLGTNTKLIPGAGAISVDRPFRACFAFRANLAPGRYRLTVALHKGLTHTAGCYHWKDDAAHFEVLESAPAGPPWLLRFEWAPSQPA